MPVIRDYRCSGGDWIRSDAVSHPSLAPRDHVAGDHIDIMQVCLDASQLGELREFFNASISWATPASFEPVLGLKTATKLT
jgi:hypothetical protein